MPTLEITEQQKVQSKVTSGLQLPQGAFSAEARAAQQLGKSVKGLADELTIIGKKIEKAERRKQLTAANLEMAKFADEQITISQKDANYTRETYEANYDQQVSTITDSMTSRGAKSFFTQNAGFQRLSGGIKMEASIHRRNIADMKLQIPQSVNASAQAHNNAGNEDEQELIRRESNLEIKDLFEAGVITEAGAKDIRRRRAMMIVMDASQKNPEIALEATKTRSSLKEILGLSDEEVALLTADDLDQLRDDAQGEVDYAKDEIAASQLQRVNEVLEEGTTLAGEGKFDKAQRVYDANLGELGTDLHGKMSTQLQKTSEIWGRDGINWNKATHNPALKAQLREQATNGTLTEPALVWQVVGRDGISRQDALDITKMIPKGGGTAKDFKETDSAKLYKTMFDATPTGKSKSPQRILALQTGYRWLEDWHKDNLDATIRQGEEEAMRIAQRVDIAALEGEITTDPADLPGDPLTPEQIRKGMEELDKIDLAEIRKRRLEQVGGNIQTFGNRPDGTPKGSGFLGVLKLKGGGVATEYSVGVRLEANDGKETDIPSLVPTLTKKEIDIMVNDIIPNKKSVPPKILQKAVDHANKRVNEGKSVFVEEPLGRQFGQIQTVTTQKQYDALAKGTRYQDSNGNVGTKR